MDSIFSGNIFLYMAIGMLGIVILEAALSGTWNRFYFTFGLPIFIRRIPVSVFSFAGLDFAKLEAEFSATWNSKSLVFKEFEPDLYAFRERMLEPRWGKSTSEVMHGILLLDRSQGEVVVRGFANWWMLATALMFITFSITLGMQGILFVAFFLVVMVIVYWMQARRFSKVAQAAAEQLMAARR